MMEQKEGCSGVEAEMVLGLRSTSDLCFRKALVKTFTNSKVFY